MKSKRGGPPLTRTNYLRGNSLERCAYELRELDLDERCSRF